jgi:hypothetical protein
MDDLSARLEMMTRGKNHPAGGQTKAVVKSKTKCHTKSTKKDLSHGTENVDLYSKSVPAGPRIRLFLEAMAARERLVFQKRRFCTAFNCDRESNCAVYGVNLADFSSRAKKVSRAGNMKSGDNQKRAVQ